MSRESLKIHGQHHHKDPDQGQQIAGGRQERPGDELPDNSDIADDTGDHAANPVAAEK